MRKEDDTFDLRGEEAYLEGDYDRAIELWRKGEELGEERCMMNVNHPLCGHRVDSEMLTGKAFLEIELSTGLSYDNERFRDEAFRTAKQMKPLSAKTVLDYGAGVGVYADAFHKAGFEVVAYEYFKAHREYMTEKVPHIKIIDEPTTTDLMLFIETAEHMTDAELDVLFSQIRPTYILFSSISERLVFDRKWGHVNIKPQDEWVSYFESLGYDKLCDLELPTDWSKLFGLRGCDEFLPIRKASDYHINGDKAYNDGNLDEAVEQWTKGAELGSEQCMKNLEWSKQW